MKTNASPEASSSTAIENKLAAIARAENRRQLDELTEDDAADGRVAVRRAVARALARSQKRTIWLEGMLADVDAEVVSWAAFGLGRSCRTSPAKTTERLVGRATSWVVEADDASGRQPMYAMARALGDCASPAAERTLVAWLEAGPSQGTSAAFGLGDVAVRNKRLEEETSAGLIRAAVGSASQSPLPEAFYPLSRLRQAPPRMEDSLRDAWEQRLGHPSPSRLFAIRAMGTHPSAVDALASVLRGADFTVEERAEAVRALGKQDPKAARRALLAGVAQMAPASDPISLTGLVGPGFGVLLAAIAALPAQDKSATDSPLLTKLAVLPMPPEAPSAVARRVVALRCAASRALARDPDEPSLKECDPDARGITGALARLHVLDLRRWRGGDQRKWAAYLDKSWPPPVRMAAIRMVGNHPEIKNVGNALAEAIRSGTPGVMAAAAEQVGLFPDRAFDGNKVVKPLAEALLWALGQELSPDSVGVRVPLVRAAGAARLEASRALLEKLCDAPTLAVRKAVKEALDGLGGQEHCTTQAPGEWPLAQEFDHLVAGPVEIELETDVGKLQIELDPTHAPVAVTRIVDLIRKGHFNGMPVHRVVPGFVVQFGARDGDDFAGAGLPTLRDELSPLPFEQGTVGIALQAQDMGSCQMFVTLAPSPHIYGDFTIVGKAKGPWNVLTVGDIIQRATARTQAQKPPQRQPG